MKKNVQFLKAGLFVAVLFSLMPDPGLKAQDYEWAKSLGGTMSDGTLDALANNFTDKYICTDTEENLYTTGRYLSDTLHIEGLAPLINNGGADVYITKQDTAGNFVWAISIGGAEDDQPVSIYSDPTDNYIYVMGYFRNDTVDFDPGPNSYDLISEYSFDVFVAKYEASSGDLVWARHIKSNHGSYKNKGFTVGASGNLYFTGAFPANAAPDLDPGPNVEQPGNNGQFTGLFIAKWDSAGNFVWLKELNGEKFVNTLGDTLSAGLGAAGQSYGLIAVDEGDNLYLTGSFERENVDFDPGPGEQLLSTTPFIAPWNQQLYYSSNDVFILKLDSAGQFVWVGGMGGSGEDKPTGLVISGAYLYIKGQFNDTADFDPGTGTVNLVAETTYDNFLARYDTAGNLIWAKQDAGTGSGFAVDNIGNIYSSGRFAGVMDLDPGPDTFSVFSPLGEYDHFVRKLDTGGNFVWARTISAEGRNENALSICTDQSNNVYYTGVFQDSLRDYLSNGDTFNLNGYGMYDVFIFKLGCGSSESEISDTTCQSSYVLNGETYIQSGTYTQHYFNTAGCDSILILHLTFAPLDVEIIRTNNVLSTSEVYNSYQWLLDGIAINGATDSFYLLSENGDYQVVVTNATACTDTSDILTIDDYTSIATVDGKAKLVRIFPNPAEKVVNIKAPFAVNISLIDLSGSILEQRINVREIDLSGYEKGVYLLKVYDTESQLIKTVKLVKR